jgi:hypothetical protein
MFILFISGYLRRTFVNMELVERGPSPSLRLFSSHSRRFICPNKERACDNTSEELSVRFAGNDLFRTLRLNYSDCVLTRLLHGITE